MNSPQNEDAAPDLQSASPGEDGSYVVVARRYRPLAFDELVGQDHVGRALKNAIETSRVGHAYLFTGARGVGKTSTARIFAKALNNPGGSAVDPDQSSDIAQAIDAGEDVDVIEIDGASNRGIDEIRSLRANIGVRPSLSRYKIYIIDEVHMLTGAAFNALLKTLEEPPDHVKFIFCTTDPEKLPITVLSRCQRFDFAPVEVSKIAERLADIVQAENAEADDEALELIARRASGSMRDSQSLLEQVLSFSGGRLTADLVHQMLGTADDVRLHALAHAMADRDAASALSQLDAGIDAGVDAGRLAEQLLGYFRDLMAVAVGCEPAMLRHTSASLHPELKQLADRWGLQTVLAVVGLVDQTLVRIRHSVYARVLLESTLIQICTLPDLQAISDLAAAAKSLPAGSTLKAPTRSGSQTSQVVSAPVAPSNGEEKKKLTEVGSVPHSNRPTKTGTIVRVDQPENAILAHESSTIASAPPVVSDSPAPSGQGTAIAERTTTVPQVASPAKSLTANDLKRGWDQALTEMDSMTATLARAVQEVQPTDAGGLRLVFPATAGLAMGRCDRPDHRKEITSTLRRITGKEIPLSIISAPRSAADRAPVKRAPTKSRSQRMREIEGNPLIQACIEIFEAELTKVDVPRNE